MVYIRKRIVAIALMFLGVLTLLAGCNEDKYKNLKLEVSQSEIEIVLDEDNPQNNLFSISATVSKMPKGYDGSVTFSVAVNDFITVVDAEPEVNKGVSVGVFQAQKQGGPVIIAVRTNEGNLSKQITVRVVKPIKSISFTQSTIPVVKGEKTDISQFLSFDPDGTSQNGIKLELTPASSSADDLIKIETDGKYLTVPSNVNIADFNIKARSTVNDQIVSGTALAKVVSIIPVKNIKLMHNNNTPENRDDDVEVSKNGNEYDITLATNASDSYSKTVYFNFNDILSENANYIVTVKGLTDSGAIVDNNGVVNPVIEIDKTLGEVNSFDLNAIGNGKTKVEFIINRADFPDYEPFTQTIVLNIKVEAFPTEIQVTNGTTSEPLSEIRLYANYNESANVYGTRFRIVVLNETGEMTNQKVIASVNIGSENIVLYDRFKSQILFGQETSSSFDYYLTHNFKSIPSEKIYLTITSASYNKVFLSIPVVIETEPLVLSTSKPTVYVDTTKPDQGVSLAVEGISANFDLTTLTVDLVKNDTSDATKLITVEQNRNQILVYPKGDIGECYINVVAENGSQVVYKIVLFESLNLKNTYVTIAGHQIMAVESLTGNPDVVLIKNGLNVPIYYTINGKSYATLVGTGLNYQIDSSSPTVVRYLNATLLQTQNMAGESTITIKIVGYNEEGEQDKKVYFAITLKVTIPLSSLSTTTSEKSIYELSSLSDEQKSKYGKHDIILASAPSNASFGFSDIEWFVEYEGDEHKKYDSEGGVNENYIQTVNGLLVTIEIIVNDNLTVKIETNTTDFRKATVSCIFDRASTTDRETFTVVAKIDQEFYNENGVLIPASKSAKVRFIATSATKVSDFLLTNLSGTYINKQVYYELVFDERDLGYNGINYTTNNQIEIPFTIQPANALNKNLKASSNNSNIEVIVDNANSKIIVQLNTKISSSNSNVYIEVTPEDDGSSKKQIQVRVLDGSKQNPYEIKTEDDLKKINASMDANYVLVNNVYISQNTSWLPIGYTYGGTNGEDLILNQFSGTLSGKHDVKFGDQVLQTNYYSINGYAIKNSSIDYYGLFAYLGTNSVVQDLTINDFVITASYTDRNTNMFVGGLAGYADGAIYNVSVNDNSGVASFDGTYYENISRGVSNQTKGIYITSSTNSNQKAYYFIGGLVGFVNNGRLGSGIYVGTTPSDNFNAEESIELKTTNPTTLTEPVGGEIINSSASVQINSYAGTNNIEYVGGLVGFNNKVVIENKKESEITSASNSSDVVVSINASVAPEEKIHNINSAYGGVAGFNNGTIHNVSAKASVFGEYDSDKEQYYMSNIGGIAGYNTGKISNTESYPLIRGFINIGGVVGKSDSAIVYISNTVSGTEYNFVNGIYSTGTQSENETVESDTKLFTLDQSVNFNKNFEIKLHKFENEIFTFNQIKEVLKGTYLDVNATDNTVESAIMTLYDLSESVLNLMKGDNSIREDFVLLKVSRTNLLENNTSTKYITGKTNLNINKDYYDNFSPESIVDALSRVNINIIEGNSVKFLDLNDEITKYNTAIIGYQNVGGIVGEFNGVVAVKGKSDYYLAENSDPLTTTSNYVISNPIAYNSVYNYSTDSLRPINESGYSEGTYGNILLADSHDEGASLDKRNYAGGIVGKLSNGAIINSQANAVIQGKMSGIGGIAGKADGVIKINDSFFIGTLYNKTGSVADVTCATGGIVGDALSATTTFSYVGKCLNSSPEFMYAPSKITVKNTSEGEPEPGYNNIANCYYVAKTLNDYVVPSTTVDSYNSSLGYVGEGLKTVNIAYYDKNNKPVNLSTTEGSTEVKYKEVQLDILKVNQTTVGAIHFINTNEKSVYFTNQILIDTLNEFKNDAGVYSIDETKVDSNGDGLNDSDTTDIENKLKDGEFAIDRFKEELLKKVVWYQNHQLNGGLPVLLSKDKLVALESGYRIDVLADYPPTAINVTYVENNINSFIAQINSSKTSIIYHYELNEDSYNSNGSDINFGLELTESAKTFYTEDLNSRITELNKYNVSDILDVKTIPSFIKANNFVITSSDSNKLSVEYDSSNKVYFLAKSAGSVTLTFASTYDTSVCASVVVNIVNATTNMELSYYSSNNKKVINYDDTIKINKSSTNNVITLPIHSKLNSTYRYMSGERIDKTFNLLENTNGGIRYYYLGLKNDNVKNHSSIYHKFENAGETPENILNQISISINNTAFKYEAIGNNSYVFYVDVPYGNEANIVALSDKAIDEFELLAVPYLVGYDNLGNQINRPLITIGEDECYGISQTDKIYGIDSTSKDNFTKFTVKITEANWSINRSVDSISFDVFESPSFNIEVETDKSLAEINDRLFVAYYDVNNLEKVVSVKTLLSNTNFNSQIQIGNLTLYLNTYKEIDNYISYNFSLFVKTENQLNVQDAFTRTIRFFVAKEDVEINEVNGYVVNPISTIIDTKMQTSIPVTVNPQEIKEITLKHYPNSESVITTTVDGTKITEINLNEIAYDNVIPGYVGLLKAYVSPYFASFDKLQLVSSGNGNDVIQFEQMLAVVEETEYGIVYTGKYQTLVVKDVAIANGITLQKQSYINQNGEIVYDGNIYVRTLINSFVTENESYTLTLTAYKNSVLKKQQSITLSVQTPPSLVLSVNGDKQSPIARGTELEITATLNGDVSKIDFTSSYVYELDSNGNEVQKYNYGTLFTINNRNNKYYVTTDYKMSTKLYIKVIGIVTKTINGDTVTQSDSIVLKVTDFVIEEITVERVEGGNITGYFNQPYALVVRIKNATYSTKLSSIVTPKITQLEKEFSQVLTDKNANTVTEGELLVWKVVNTAYSTNDKKRYSGIDFENQTSNSFKIAKTTVSSFGDESVSVYSLQNTKFGSADKLAAMVKFVYLDDGIKALNSTSLINEYSQSNYLYEKVCEFGFNFYRVRDEERPDPIETAEQFKAMEDGVDYILTSDIVLTDWEPFSDDLSINSLDGNGYVITIESFKLDEYQSDDQLIESKNIGIFGKINSETTIKNLIIEVKPKSDNTNIEIATSTSKNVDLYVDARAYKNVNFGLLAGENAGIVTNVQIVKDATQLIQEREQLIANSTGGSVSSDTDNKNTTKYSNRNLSVVMVETTATLEEQTNYISGLIGRNLDEGSDAIGYITNSSVEDITINGIGYVAGFVADNSGKISSSYFKGANVINRAAEGSTMAATSGFVVFNKGDNSAVQYSYVQGRLNSKTDTTGLVSDNNSSKGAFAGVNFLGDLSKEGDNASSLEEIANLRALNSAVSSKTLSSAFVYENDGIISNTYANIMVNSTMRTSGFVFYNKSNGTISSSYSLSSVKLNDRDASPFTGRSETHTYNNDNPTGYTDAHYLKIGAEDSASTYEKNFAEEFIEEFIDDDEPATALAPSDFWEYNTFQGYAFNTDFELNSEEKVTRAVWFIPNSMAKENLYKDGKKIFKGNDYGYNRPELVAANLKTVSVRVWTGTDDDNENNYMYVSDVIGESIKNPRLVKTAEDFNRYFVYESNISETGRNFAVRFVSDITFNKTDLTAQTYTIDYYGDLDGNGMTINELRLVSDTDFETGEDGNGTITHLGLFGRIITENDQRGVVRNLNIDVDEVRGSKVTYVGALAGSIENADVFNINISGDEIIQGRNIVGGLAGIVLGDSEIVNITSSLSAKASYFKDINIFSENYAYANSEKYKTFNLYATNKNDESEQKAGGTSTTEILNATTISYVGGIIGILDVDKRDDGSDPLSLFNSKARKLVVKDSVTLIAEIVGGVVGLNGVNSTMSDISFIVNENETPHLKASRVAGGLVGENRGSIDRSYVQHNSLLQKEIDNEYKRLVTTTASNPTVYSSSLNYNDLFTGNPHYIGGLVGINNGGELENCYNRINVININSMFAGGVVGISIGGTYSTCYTTSSVGGFFASGGFAGVEWANKKSGDTEENSANTSNNTEEEKDYISTIKENDRSYVYFDIHINGDKSNVVSENGSRYSGIVATNIWRKEDLNLDRSKRYNNANLKDLKIGAFIGVAVTQEDSKTYNISNLTRVSDASNSERLKNETNFFNMVKLPDSNQYIPEIGALGSTAYNDQNFEEKIVNNARTSTGTISYSYKKDGETKVISVGQRASNKNVTYNGEDGTQNSVTIDSSQSGYRPTGVSGYIIQRVENANGDTQIIFYQYSRLQNIGSGRTLKEIIQDLDIMSSEEQVTIYRSSDDENKIIDDYFGASNKITTNEMGSITKSTVYGIWNTKRWVGVQKANAADLATVFPYLEAKPEETKIRVTNEAELKKMKDYPNAEFILMNDITLSSEWEPVGTSAVPFKGKLHSDDGKHYSIINLKISDKTSSNVGLIAYALEANLYDFDLQNVEIETQNEIDPYFIGSLVAYSLSGTNINNVNVNNVIIKAKNVATVGGLVGYSGQAKITNSTVNNPQITISSFVNDMTKVASDVDKILAVGGVAGMVTGLDTVVMNNVHVKYSGKINVTGNFEDSILSGVDNMSIDVGGLVGRINSQQDQDSELTQVKGCSTMLNINSNLYLTGVTSEITSVNIGGLVGNAYKTVFANSNDVEVLGTTNSNNGEEPDIANGITSTIINFGGTVNCGGAIGTISSVIHNDISINTSGNSENAIPNYDINNITVGKNACYELKVTTQGVSNKVTKQNVGGVVGNANNAIIENLYANIYAIGNINNTTNKSYAFLSTGGLIGEVYNCQSITNGYVLGKVSSNTVNSECANTAVGGAFGRVIMASTEDATIQKVVANTETVVDGSNLNTSPVGIGGFVGVIYSGTIDQCACYGDVVVNNANKFAELYVGGFVGRTYLTSTSSENSTDLNNLASDTKVYNNFMVGFKNVIKISNCYTVSDILAEDMFTSTSDTQQAGLFVGNINCVVSEINYLTLQSNYTIGKFIYNYDGNISSSLYEEKINKGGFLGGYTFGTTSAIQNVTNQNVTNVPNLLFVNNWYNKDFIPYSNDWFEGKTTEEMLFGSGFDNYNTKDISFAVDGENVWEKSDNAYPMLMWINDTNRNTVCGVSVANLQYEGSKVRPAICDMDSSAIESDKSYIVRNYSIYKDLNNNTLYLKNSVINREINIDNKSVLYGLDHIYSSNSISANDGLIVNTKTNKMLVTTNNGVIYQVTFDITDGYNVDYLVQTNNGVFDSFVLNTSTDNDKESSNIVGNGTGYIYRTALRNGSTSLGGKAKESYYILLEINASYYLEINATFYDANGKDYKYIISTTDYLGNIRNISETLVSASTFDFTNDWIFVNSNSKELNYGAPILRYELYGTIDGRTNFYGEILNDYKWATELSEAEYNALVKKYSVSSIEVASADEFANISKITSIGYNKSTQIGYNESTQINGVTRKSSSTDFLVDTISATSLSDGMKGNAYLIKEYKYGILYTTETYRMNFAGKTITLTNDIDLSGKLWTPIGVGFDSHNVTDSSSYTFKGIFDGNGKTIENATVIETNKNVGLFGTVETGGGNFAKSLIIKDSNFVSVSYNNGISVAGTLAGRAIVSTTNADSPSSLIHQVGTQDANVYATNIASGLIGQVIKGAISGNVYTKVQYAYVNSNVTAKESASMFIHFGYTYDESTDANNIKKQSENISELYFVGTLTGSEKSSFENLNISKCKNFGNAKLENNNLFNSVYGVGVTKDNYLEPITEGKLKTEAIEHFSWGSKWDRIDGVNENYPVLNTEVQYWVQDLKQPNADENGQYYLIYEPQELAWIANQVNVGVLDKNVKLENDIDLGGKIWSPIGYSEFAFKKEFDFNGQTISNIETSGTYLIVGDEIKCKDYENVGLFGYTDGAIILSRAKDKNDDKIKTGKLEGSTSRIVAIGNVGALIGYAKNTEVENIENYITVTSTYGNDDDIYGAGGLIGKVEITNNKDIKISNVQNHGVVLASKNRVGGIVGYVYGLSGSFTIEKSRNTKKIESSKDYVGGLVGCSNATLYINGLDNWSKDDKGNVSSTPDNQGDINGNNYVGGIVGGGYGINIECVTNSGKVTAIANSAGGIVGDLSSKETTQTSSIYEVINTAEITAANYAGGIVGNAYDATRIKMVNMFNKGTSIAGLIGAILKNIDSDLQIYAGISETGNVLINGIDNDSAKANGLFIGTSNIDKTNTTITYDGTKYVTYKEVFEQSLVWSGVFDNKTKLDYRNQPDADNKPSEDSEKKKYKIEKEEHLKYLNELNRKRYGISCLQEGYGISFENNLTLSSVRNLGYGAYPWRSEIDGGSKTITIKGFESGVQTHSVFGAIFGNTNNKTEVHDMKLLYSCTDTVENSGLYMQAGRYVKLSNLIVLNNDTGVSSTGNFGAISAQLYNSTVENCNSEQKITNSSNTAVNVGGLFGEITDVAISGCLVNADITVAATGAKVGGIAGYASSSNKASYCISGCKYSYNNDGTHSVDADKTIRSESENSIAGGIVGDSNNYSYNNNTVGQIVMDSNEKYDGRTGVIVAKIAGGIVGQSTSDNIIGGTSDQTCTAADIGENDKTTIAGGIVGKSSNTTINSVVNKSFVRGKTAGGFVGESADSSISNSLNNSYGEIVADTIAGGFVGQLNLTSISSCTNLGYVASLGFSTDKYVGGAIGKAVGGRLYNVTLSGYTGIYRGAGSVTTTCGYGINYYYSRYNIDNEDKNPITANGSQGGQVWGKDGTYGVFNYARVNPYNDNLQKDKVKVDDIDEEKSFTLFDCYVKITNNTIFTWAVNCQLVYITAYKNETEAKNEYGGFSLEDKPTAIASITGAYTAAFWVPKRERAVATLTYSAPDIEYFPANSDMAYYNINYVDNEHGNSSTKKAYDGTTITLKTGMFQEELDTDRKDIKTYVDWEIVKWEDQNGKTYNAGASILINDKTFPYIDKSVTLTAVWEKAKNIIYLYGRNGIYPETDISQDENSENNDNSSESLMGAIKIPFGEGITDFTFADSDRQFQVKDLNGEQNLLQYLNRDGYRVVDWYKVSPQSWNYLIELGGGNDEDKALNANKALASLLVSGFDEMDNSEKKREANKIRTKIENKTYTKLKTAEFDGTTMYYAPSGEYGKGYSQFLVNTSTTFTTRGDNIFVLWMKTWKVKYYIGEREFEDEYTYDHGTTVNCKEGTPVKSHYIFQGWYLATYDQANNKVKASEQKFTSINQITSDIYVIAKWEPKKYDVTFNYFTGDNIKKTNTIQVEYNKYITTTLEYNQKGHIFDGWKVTAVDTSIEGNWATLDKIYSDVALKELAIKGNITVEAQYTINQYDVTFKVSESAESSLETYKVNYKGKLEIDYKIPDSQYPNGYVFAGWKYKENGVEYDFKTGEDGTVIVGPLTVYATWTPREYGITYVDADTKETLETDKGKFGQPIDKPTDISKDGYRISGYYTDENCSKEVDFVNGYERTEDMTIYVKFVQQYVVTFIIESNYSKTGEAVTINENVDINTQISSTQIPNAVSYMANSDVVNKCWKTSDASYTDLTTYTVTSNVTFYWYAEVKITFKENISGTGGIDFKDFGEVQYCEYNKPFTKPVTDPVYGDDTEYGFDGYYKDMALTKLFNFDENITKHTTIYIKFTEKKTVTLSVNNITFSVKVVKGKTLTLISNGDGTYKISGTSVSFDPASKYWKNESDGLAIEDLSTYIVNDDVTLILSNKMVSVRYHYYNNSKEVVTKTSSVDYGYVLKKSELPTEVENDEKTIKYSITDYYSNIELNSEFNFETSITSDIDIYVKTSILQVKVVYMYDIGDGLVEYSDLSDYQNYSTQIQKPTTDPTLEGYVFKNYYSDSSLTNEFVFNNEFITDSKIVYIKFVESVTVTILKSNNSVYKTIQIEKGSTISSSDLDDAAKNSGIALSDNETVQWVVVFEAGNTEDFNIESTITSDITIKAVAEE